MSIYRPRAFATDDGAAVAQLIRDFPFATLITPGDPEPFVSHVPLQYDASLGPKGALLGHMARANPHWRHFGAEASIAIFHGPHAYVSPSWYAEPATAVPTWNYAIAHVYGRVEVMVDAAETRALLDTATRRSPFPYDYERIDGKLKLSQNRSARDRERVIAALRGEDYADAAATAEWMERYARGS